MNYQAFLNKVMIASFGCTEPIALAYAAAKAKTHLIGDIESITARCSGNIIKNVYSVSVPGTDGRKGLEISAVAGAFWGNADLKLEVLSEIPKEELPKADAFIAEGHCRIVLEKGVPNLYIHVILENKEHSSEVIIADAHTNIVKEVKDGIVVYEHHEVKQEESFGRLDFDEIYDYISGLSDDELAVYTEKLDQLVEYNMAISNEGLMNEWGSCIGKMIMDAATTFEERATAYGAAGSDARMSGCELPVIINSGSGNQGITCTVPIILYARENDIAKKDLYKALLFAYLVAELLKQGIGKLSAYCGVVSAASAAVAGIAFLKGESRHMIEETLSNALAVNSGIICDGAKPSCAMKIASSLRNAFLAYKQAEQNHSFRSGDGIVAGSLKETLERISNIAVYGMKTTDEVIISEMIGDKSYK